MELTERQMQAMQMRREGKKLREIAEALNVSTSRARQMIERAERLQEQSEWAEGLPSRYVTALVARGIKSRDQLKAAVSDGSLARMPGIGPKCHKTVVEWLG